MQYSFTCPLERCNQIMTIEARNTEETVDRLTEVAREHLSLIHPDMNKTYAQILLEARSHVMSVS